MRQKCIICPTVFPTDFIDSFLVLNSGKKVPFVCRMIDFTVCLRGEVLIKRSNIMSESLKISVVDLFWHILQ